MPRHAGRHWRQNDSVIYRKEKKMR